MTNGVQAGLDEITHNVDVCVVGGGMAGLCAAIASARNGAKTVLVHDRPVLGGNASSEVRMWICGAIGKNVHETGLLEEIQLDNAHLNPGGNYSVWDAVLWHKATIQPNLTLLLNTTCCDGTTEPVAGDPTQRRISCIRCWQMTSQSWHTIGARIFIDCSGDSILAPVSGAEVRRGRESRAEFGEDIEPHQADRKTMGNSLLIQVRRTDEVVPFTAPSFAYRFDSPDDLPFRIDGVQAHNFWWLELGGLQDTIKESELIRDELMRVAWGVWDYIKNRAPEREQAANWALEWVGSLPGKRENRRYVGGHILTQNDIRAAGDPAYFDDAIAYGGWPMDDHHPAGLLFPGQPTIFHSAPSPYVIPYRCLFSCNVSNLMMAGRNISVTHAALSSTRVMGTCALLGQAAGTAAAIAIARKILPGQLYPHFIPELQQTLALDDCWIPGRSRAVDPISRGAVSSAPATLLGHDRPLAEAANAWEGQCGQALTLRWDQPVDIGAARIVFDSNLNHDKRMPCRYPQSHSRQSMPRSLVKEFRLDIGDGNDNWQTVYRGVNHQRLREIAVGRRASALRIVPEESWGDATIRLFGFEATTACSGKLPEPPERLRWQEVIQRQDLNDLRPPDAVVEEESKRRIGA